MFIFDATEIATNLLAQPVAGFSLAGIGNLSVIMLGKLQLKGGASGGIYGLVAS